MAALQQISLSLSVKTNTIAAASATDIFRQVRDLETIRQYVRQRLGDAPLPFNIAHFLSPFNICMSKLFASHVKEVHHLLDKALIDIVDRWFSDEKAAFPTRMPLEKHEEDVLRWIDGPASKFIASFGERYGMWRTDYLIERDQEGKEVPRICEINARIPFNGFFLVGVHEAATKELGAGMKGFECANEFETTVETIVDCFDRTKTLFHIRSKWPGVDSRLLAVEYERRTGHPMITVHPSELQLKEDPTSPTGHRLWYQPTKPTDGENGPAVAQPQRIDQCSLELFQEEIAELDLLLLRQIATSCTNDLRTILLLHDKRILGIVLEELHNLVERHILTPAEASTLKGGIADTLLPGTARIRSLYQQSLTDASLKDGFIIKPARDASCNGILLGARMTQEVWLQHLSLLSSTTLLPHEEACVVQQMVDHVWYDIVRNECDGVVEQYHLIASGHMIASRLFVCGPMRIGEDVHVGFQGERTGVIMSAVLSPDLPVFEE